MAGTPVRDPLLEQAQRSEVLALLHAPAPTARVTDDDAAAWDHRLALAGSRLHPWLAYRLDLLGMMGNIPNSTREYLRSVARASAVAELRRRRLFVDCVDALDAAAVPIAVLKGLALSYTVYPVPATRTMSDIDLWVQPDRFQDALRALATLGWRIPDRYAVHALGPTDTRMLERPGNTTLLEVHVEPLSICHDSSGYARVWGRCESRTIAGREVQVLSLGDQLAHLALHTGRKHGFSDGLRGLLDLALTARQVPDAAAWRAIGVQHREERAAPWGALCLTLARDLLHAPVSDDYFIAANAPELQSSIVGAVHVQLWDRQASPTQGLNWMLSGTAGGSGHALLSYVKRFYGAPGADGRPWWRALAGRLRYDLSHRVGRYFKAFRRGEFRRSRVAHGARMIRERAQLVAAVEAQDPNQFAPTP